MKAYSIYISGVGGQGIIKTSVVIGEAAMKTGQVVVMSEIHGMAQRGGGVSTELKIGHAHSSIIADGTADLLLAFEPLEALRALPKISKNTRVVMNTSRILPFNIQGSELPYPPLEDILEEMCSKSQEVKALDAVKVATQAGHILAMNMVMLGAALTVPGFPLDKKTLMESMKANLPERTVPINTRAFEQGFGTFS
ncbi:indolepyruvate oxidoreductase subunit beta [Methanobacterium sp. CWC-01]|uniref:indolepyruvate oxidoreductase subunit beta n=1 Tax=Methanobacterium aridiramus TaxID=2584467 RepID=UPI0025789574|nr:indolepyruvate oxidoreductase subunit beta [Methanobacterium sp. CWC-01]WJI10093.1 indolepyruvate oxidoreductase subunit beta [Methanobacterium sp. CWC-01]